MVSSLDHHSNFKLTSGGTQRYFRRIVSPQMGIKVDFHDFLDEIPFQENTKLIWLETPTNPTLKLTDISMVATKAKKQQCLLAVDNTFCSPYFQTPLDLGADIVVHSVTKYIGGHSDVVLGVVCTNMEALYNKLRFIQNGVGAVPSPFDCFLAHRGLKTLHIRMEASAKNANAIAMFLETHRAVKKVSYPGLSSHPQYELAQRQQHGFGAMITFYCVGGRKQSAVLLENVSTLNCFINSMKLSTQFLLLL
jgi:cystathionine gamma-lyase